MSRSGVSERILFLRRRVAAIEANGASPPAQRPGPGPGGEEDARDPLERLLNDAGGGGLTEIVPSRPRDASAAAAFACALALRAASARPGAPLVWIVEDMAAREIGLPYGRGLMAAGLDPARLVLVRVRRPRETLWAMEEALKTSAAAVVAESWMAPRLYDLVASRRLSLAARRGAGAGLLLPLRAAGEAGRLASAASRRFEIAAPSDPRGREALAAFGVLVPNTVLAPTAFAWRLRVAKARAGPFGAFAFDPLLWRDLAFDPQTAVFRHAFPRRLPAPPFDRPAVAPARGERA